MIDIFANYWFEYLNQEGIKNNKHGERFKKYTEKFCLTNNNEIFKISKLLSNLTVDNFYKFRCALVHFYGVGIQNIAVAGDESIDLPEEYLQSIIKELKLKLPEITILRPREMRDLVIDSVKLMLEQFIIIVNNSRIETDLVRKHTEGIDRIYQKLMKEGAIGVNKHSLD